MPSSAIQKRTYTRVSKRTGKAETRIVWRARYVDPDKPGANAKIEQTFPTKRAAQAWLTRQAAAVQNGSHVDPRKGETLVREVAEMWRGTWNAKPLSLSTQLSYSTLLRVHILPRWGHVRVGAVSTAGVEKWIGELAQVRHAETCHHAYTALRQIMLVAVKQGLIGTNPCAGVTLPSKKAAQARSGDRLFLTAAEVRKLADAMPAHWRLPTLVAAYCGLRAGELWALRRCDVDPLHGRLRVRYALKEVQGRTIAGPTKTHAERSLTIPAPLRPLLAAAVASPGVRLRKVRKAGVAGYPAIVAGEFVWTADAQSPERLLFTTETGHPVQHSNFFRRRFRPTVGRLWPQPHRLHGLWWHDLRHTCASLSLAATGGNLHVVKERLGHSTITVTVDRYGKLLPSVDEALADALAAMYEASDEDNVVELHAAEEA